MLIGKKVLIGASVMALLAFSVHYYMLHSEIDSLEEKVVEYKVAVKEYQQNEKEFQSVIQEQNESIEKHKQRAEDLLVRSEELEEERAKQEEQFQQKLNDIKTEDAGKTCSESMDYLRQFPNNR